jgi:hypothetical protein
VPPLLPIVAVLVTLAAARGAPSPEEERLFAQGLQAFEAGDARAAERAWKQGYAVARDPAFLVRIGEAEEKAGAAAEAADSYRRYLREAPDASDRADIEGRLARLAPGRPTPPGPAGQAPADEPPRNFGEAPAPTLPPTPGPGPGDEVQARAVDLEAAHAPAGDEGPGWTPANVTAWSAAGATALLLGTAAFFGAQAASKEGDVNRLQSSRDFKTGAPYEYSGEIARQYESALADGRRYSRDAKIFLLAAAGTAAVSCVFFVIDGVFPSENRSTVALAPALEGKGAVGTLGWRF